MIAKNVKAILPLIQESFTAEDKFKDALVENNRGKYLIFLHCENIQGIKRDQFVKWLPELLQEQRPTKVAFFQYYWYGTEKRLYIGMASVANFIENEMPNVDGALGKAQAILAEKYGQFEFGIGRTKSNYISDVDEIYHELIKTSSQNLKDNRTRWSWTSFNRVNDYFARAEIDAVIQPILKYDHHNELYSIKGGEVFIGGANYRNYGQLMNDIPDSQDKNRIDLLITEKLLEGLKGAPGLLKINISPQSLIDTFATAEKVERFIKILTSNKLSPLNVRIELIEKPYEENEAHLKDVCRLFWQYGISFAADDFGVKSQSHQVVLDLGEMIKEFKLDPISFKFKPEEDHTKFLDNLAFIDYCKRLADNREAIITAEAVNDYDTLRFLIAHQVYHFQTNLFCKKLTIAEYTESFSKMHDLKEDDVRAVLTSESLLKKQKRIGNIFKVIASIKKTP